MKFTPNLWISELGQNIAMKDSLSRKKKVYNCLLMTFFNMHKNYMGPYTLWKQIFTSVDLYQKHKCKCFYWFTTFHLYWPQLTWICNACRFTLGIHNVECITNQLISVSCFNSILFIKLCVATSSNLFPIFLQLLSK